MLLTALIPTIEHAQAIYETMRAYMQHEDDLLPETIKLVPAGRLGFFDACKHTLVTKIINAGADGQPQWALPLRILYYLVMGVGMAMGLPFILGIILAEMSSKELQFPADTLPPTGDPLPNVQLLPSGHTIFASWEKPFYIAAMLAGVGFWAWLLHYIYTLTLL